MEEDIIFNTDQPEGKSSDNNVIVIDEEDQAAGRKKSLSSGDLGTIYIDDNNGENSEESHSIDISQHGWVYSQLKWNIKILDIVYQNI